MNFRYSNFLFLISLQPDAKHLFKKDLPRLVAKDKKYENLYFLIEFFSTQLF